MYPLTWDAIYVPGSYWHYWDIVSNGPDLIDKRD
jgi:hypothetical protein